MNNLAPSRLKAPLPLRVELGERGYDIRFHDNEPGEAARAIKEFCPEGAFVVSNETIWRLHGGAFMTALREAGISASAAMAGDGERFKTLDSAAKLYDELIRGRFGRRTCVIAFGGGVVGDLAGFVAATFMRGVTFIQVPTTVIAMVDSSIGGKTGVDHPMGKNLIGAFHQPRLVVIDVARLRSLDAHNIRGGFAEVIKCGVIDDADFFGVLETEIENAMALEPAPLMRAVRRSCEIKARIVSADEREGGLRATLNYGHTFAHAIESLSGYAETQFHGQAVAIGMIAAAEVAGEMGLFSAENRQRLRALIRRAGLPDRIPGNLEPSAIVRAMKTDKKVVGGRQRFVLPVAIGKTIIRDDVPEAVIERVIARMREEQSVHI